MPPFTLVRRPYQYHALVLCPNLALCKQVQDVVARLLGADGKPLLTAAIVSAAWPLCCSKCCTGHGGWVGMQHV